MAQPGSRSSQATGTAPDRPHPRPGRKPVDGFDVHVARRVREQRTLKGLGLPQLAAAMGVTYQQVHKYETGLNRITVGRLYAIAAVLGVDVSYFFEGLTPTAPSTPRLVRRRQLELMQAFSMITDRRHQEALCGIVKALADLEADARGHAE
jgi:transcriptional regulator with XRE-family HTH domain